MTVVHCRQSTYTHYIGRPSPLGNPYRVGAGGTRAEAIQKFETYARQSPRVLAMIRDLPEDAILGCWCSPKPCHGSIIVQLWKELHENK